MYCCSHVHFVVDSARRVDFHLTSRQHFGSSVLRSSSLLIVSIAHPQQCSENHDMAALSLNAEPPGKYCCWYSSRCTASRWSYHVYIRCTCKMLAVCGDDGSSCSCFAAVSFEQPGDSVVALLLLQLHEGTRDRCTGTQGTTTNHVPGAPIVQRCVFACALLLCW